MSAAVASGSFRANLFYRLNVFPIKVPPLCERVLVEYFVKRFAAEEAGRSQELKVVQRALILCERGELSVDPSWIRPQIRGHPTRSAPFVATVLCQEQSLIEAALHETAGRIAGTNGAATKLGIPRTTLEPKIKRLEINKHQSKQLAGYVR